MESPLEQRRYHRLIVSLPLAYHGEHPETGEIHRGDGNLTNISLNGGYFHVDHPVPFKIGQMLSLTIAAPLSFADSNQQDPLSHLKVKGEIVRLDPPCRDCPRYGIALDFLESPSFFNPSPLDI